MPSSGNRSFDSSGAGISTFDTTSSGSSGASGPDTGGDTSGEGGGIGVLDDVELLELRDLREDCAFLERRLFELFFAVGGM